MDFEFDSVFIWKFRTNEFEMKKIIFPLFMVFVVTLVGCGSHEDVLGTYQSANNGSIEITSYDGREGEFTATQLILPRLNNGNPYSTSTGFIEVFTVTRSVGSNHTIRFAVGGVAYIGVFNASNMSVTVEGVIYNIT